MSTLIAVALFVVGAVLAIWATERLLEGLVSLATLLRPSAFAVGAALSGLEAENIALGPAAGNLVGTLLYFVLGNLGLIALLTPVRVDPLVRHLDWPFLVAVTWIAAASLWRGRIGRGAGLTHTVAYVGYVALHVLLRCITPPC